MSRRWMAALIVSLTLGTSVASAQEVPNGHEGDGTIRDRSEHTDRPLNLSMMGYAGWYYGIGVGFNARFEIPILKDGFIPQINDQFSLEPSFSIGYSRPYWVDVYTGDRYHTITLIPALYAIWSFHITPKFRPYGGIGLGYAIGIATSNSTASGFHPSFFYWDPVVGLYYNFNERIAFRGEVGGYGVKAGISIFF